MRLALLLLFAAPLFGQDTTATPPPHHQDTTETPPTLPDPQLTPGAIRTSDASEICAKSFRTKKYRHTTKQMKKQVCLEYHIAAKCPDAKHMELDHDLPLELGGNDVIGNLWPQMAPAFKRKDKLENRLKVLVCKEHAMTLPVAQSCIISNWAVCYTKVFGVQP